MLIAIAGIIRRFASIGMTRVCPAAWLSHWWQIVFSIVTWHPLSDRMQKSSRDFPHQNLAPVYILRCALKRNVEIYKYCRCYQQHLGNYIRLNYLLAQWPTPASLTRRQRDKYRYYVAVLPTRTRRFSQKSASLNIFTKSILGLTVLLRSCIVVCS